MTSITPCLCLNISFDIIFLDYPAFRYPMNREAGFLGRAGWKGRLRKGQKWGVAKGWQSWLGRKMRVRRAV